jgi:hypothetical protein
MAAPPPPKLYDLNGWSATGRLRMRSGWFGFVVLEELYEHRDGTTGWRRASVCTELPRP